MSAPETKYAKNGDMHIAYQVVGDGPIDLVYVPGMISHLEIYWEEPLIAAFFNRLARFARVIVFDKRGSGMSDRVPPDEIPTLEVRMDDVGAVMDAAGSERAALMGTSEGGPMCALFAATYPERVLGLILNATYPRALKDEEFPEGWLLPEDARTEPDRVERKWAEGAFEHLPEWMFDDLEPEELERVERWWARFCKMSVSPGAAAAIARMGNEIDIRHILPTIRVPTLATVRSGDENLPATRYMAEHIPGARFVELAGAAHAPYFGAQEPLIAEIEEFLTGVRPAPADDRVLATVLFTDIVGSTQLAERLGDRAWVDLLGAHNAAVRQQLERFRGREVDTAGDGFLATFDGPARGPVRLRDPRLGARGRCRDPGGSPHRRVRADRGQGPRDRCAHRSARRGQGRARRSARLEHREGPGRRLRPGLRGSRDAHPQGCARRVAAVRRGRQLSYVDIVPSFELDEATLGELTSKLESGELTARTLADAYLARIESIDQAGPELRSVIEVNPDALAIADTLDRERAEGHVRGPLHGIPILVKDNIDTADGMKTTAGSCALVDSRPTKDAPVIARLRDAGALLLGKTNLSEWANFRSTRSSSGWSARGGQCRNPYALDRSPCGSSSGSGVAVAANLCAVAVGTETDGSIICPSSLNGVVGIKPTVGLVSGAGIVPISHTQDTAGPMARTVADAATLLAAMAETDVAVHLDPGAMSGTRIGVARNMAGFDKRVDALYEDALQAMRDLGAELIDPADVPHATELQEPEWEVLKYEFKAGVEAYLAKVRGNVPRTLVELIAFNASHADDEAITLFGQDIFEQAEEKGPLTDPVYLELLATCGRLSREEGLDVVFGEHLLDAVVAPSGSPAWLVDHLLGDHYVGGNTSPAAISGYPSITVPMGLVAGLPVGVSFMGAARTESRLIGLAFAFEHATGFREPPRFLATVPKAGSHRPPAVGR